MIASIKHAARVVHSVLREWGKRETRSPHWPALEKQMLNSYPTCAACGGVKRRQVHHIQPYHLAPSLELDLHNLIVLCMGPNECHLRIGHGGDFKAYNPHVVADAKECLTFPPRMLSVAASAHKARLYVLRIPGGKA